VVGVDRDLIVEGFDPGGYWRMARSNGLSRALKTAARKATGIDRAYRREFERTLRLRDPIPRQKVFQRNAWEIGLESESFDLVYHLRTFMHFDFPADAVREAARVLVPEGVLYIELMPYTGPTGSLDIRVLGGAGEQPPPWAHLRPQYRESVRESAHLNGLS